MLKRMFFVMLFFVVIDSKSEKLLFKLEPGNEKKRFEIVGRKNILKDIPLNKKKDIKWREDYGSLYYHNYTPYYYMPRLVQDTQATRFTLPLGVPCSLNKFIIQHYNTRTNRVGSIYYPFVGLARRDIDWDTFPGFEEAQSRPFISPIDTIIKTFVSFGRPNLVWDTIYANVFIPPGREFFCGYVNGVDSMAILSTGFMYGYQYGNVLGRYSHSYRYRNSWGKWFSYYYTSENCKLEFLITAYVFWNAVPDTKMILLPDKLPNSYTTGPRKVYLYVQDISAPFGIDSAFIYYFVNNGPTNKIQMEFEYGDTIESVWSGGIPGVNVFDTITYRCVAWNRDHPKSTEYITYIIKKGKTGNGLYVKGNKTAIFSDYIEKNYNFDVWDISKEGGAPDSSVFDFYINGGGRNIVVWKGFGEIELSYNNYGSGVIREGDTTYIKRLLNNGGGFWLSDQDGLFGTSCSLFSDYGTHTLEDGTFLKEYIGIVKGTDDGTFKKDTFFITGEASDSVIGPLFDGVGNQIKGKILHGAVLGKASNEWTGYIDSCINVLPDMKRNDTVLSIRRSDAGVKGTGKVIFQILNSEWIQDPTHTLYYWDNIASDSLNDCYLKWLGANYVGEKEEDVDIFRISEADIRGDKIFLTIFVPKNGYIDIDVLDIMGRKIEKVYKGEIYGIKTFEYDINSKPVGVYFFSVKMNGEIKGIRKFFIIK